MTVQAASDWTPLPMDVAEWMGAADLMAFPPAVLQVQDQRRALTNRRHV